MKKGVWETEPLQQAMGAFYKAFLVRVEPFPPKELAPAFKHLSEDTTVRQTM